MNPDGRHVVFFSLYVFIDYVLLFVLCCVCVLNHTCNACDDLLLNRVINSAPEIIESFSAV